MRKAIKNTDILFCIALFFGILFLGTCLLVYPFDRDEAFYLTVPFRLVNGDSLVKHEWHLTQFSSFFSYLPTLIWVKLTGSAEGIVVFSRCVYLTIQIALTTLVYRFFREYKVWAVVAAMLFFTQGTNIMLQISYHTMLMSCLLLLAFSIISIYKKATAQLYVFTGICYGLCCICDPVLCFVFALYTILCILWKYKTCLIEAVAEYKIKTSKTKAQKKANIKKQKNQMIWLSNIEMYNYFFSQKAIIYIFIGILTTALLAVAFFFITRGTISSLIDNIGNLLLYSEYTAQGSLFDNITANIRFAIYDFNLFSFDNGFFLILLFLVLFIDNKRTNNSHRRIYLIFSFLLSIIYAIGIFRNFNEKIYFIEFPFFIFSIVCYIITKSKNKALFYCMWIPSVIFSIIHFFSSNSILTAICVVLIISNTAGVFFVADLLKEMRSKQKHNQQEKNATLVNVRYIIYAVLSLQLVFHLSFFQYGLFTPKSNIKTSVGPLSGVYMTDAQFSKYTESISDLNLIKKYADEYTPIYIVSYQSCWMYLYLDLPVAINTAYYLGLPSQELLLAYYKENPDRIPKYIYVDFFDHNNNYDYELAKSNIDILSEMFSFTEEVLSNGILLTVTDCKLSQVNDKSA